MRIRQSEFTAWRRCRRKWYFAYERDLRKQAPGTRRMPQSSYRDAGSAAHAGCAVIHEGGTLSEALTAVRAYVKGTRSFRPEGTLLPALDSVSDPEWYGVLELALAMVEGYVEWLADTGQDAGYETLAVEEPFEFEMIDGTLVYGTWDLVGRDALLGGVVIDDLKSVASFTELHAIDFQLRTYALAHWRTTGRSVG